ncbi:MAG: hypothetical protein ACYTGZ_06500 [Planctomycetota bacterium]|jgi:hypothetical protein
MRVVLLSLFVAAGLVRADSWSPYGERLEVAENGKRYIVLGPYDYEKHTTAFLIYERKADTKAPRVIENERTDENKVAVDPGDRLIKKGALKQQPLDAWMLSATPRAVLFEEYANVGGDTTLSLLQSDGKVKWRHSLDAFKLDAKKFRQSTSSLWWYEGWWVDEARGRIVLVAKGRQYREVELDTGKIHEAKEAVVLDALKSPSARVRRAMLRMCWRADEKPRGWVKRVLALRDDKSEPVPIRLEAAWAVSGQVEDEEMLAIFKAAKMHLSDEDVRMAFLHWAPDMFAEEDSAELLVALLLAHPDWRPKNVAGMIGSLGGAGIEALDEIASDDELSRKQRLAALFGLGNSRSEHGAAAFAFAARAADDKLVEDSLAWFEGQIIPPLERALAKALRHPGAGDAAIAKYLGDHARRDYVEGLEAALKRAKPDSKAHAAIKAALEKCRKQDR